MINAIIEFSARNKMAVFILIGAAVMANEGRTYREILAHYYRNTQIISKV